MKKIILVAVVLVLGCQHAAAQAPYFVDDFESYTPGEHWLHLVRELPVEDALAMELEGPEWVAVSLLSLLPIYQSILWSP